VEAALNTPAAIPASMLLREASARCWDAAVIGAGPAGAIAAISLARKGRAVVLIDKAAFPRDKVCGCCLSAAALEVLDRAELMEVVGGLRGVPLDRLRLCSGGASAEIGIRGLAISRTAFDAALVNEALREGVVFLPGVSAEVSTVGHVHVHLRSGDERASLRATTVLLCDGLAGTALRDAPFAPRSSSNSRMGVNAVVDASFEPGLIRMACGSRGYVGAVRLEDGRLNLAAAVDPEFVRAARGPGHAVGSILSGAHCPVPPALASARWHGTPTLTRRRPAVYRPGLLILGDAASYVEPFTGEGMAWAMAGGLAAAELIAEGRPDAWPAHYDRLIARRQRLCRAIAWTLRRPRLARAAIRLISLVPSAATPAVDRLNRPLLGGAA
jgi:flavin-dependent dehydrogenase